MTSPGAAKKHRSHPSTPAALGKALVRLAPDLRQVGVDVRGHRTGQDRVRVQYDVNPYEAAPRLVESVSSRHREVGAPSTKPPELAARVSQLGRRNRAREIVQARYAARR